MTEREDRALSDLRVGLEEAAAALEFLEEHEYLIEGPWEFIGTVAEAKAEIGNRISQALHFTNTIAEQAGWEASAPESGF